MPVALPLQAYFSNKEGGLLLEKVPKPNPAAMMNPMAMMDMMKGNVTFMVPNMAMMAIINNFFEGFVLVKVTEHTLSEFSFLSPSFPMLHWSFENVQGVSPSC